MDLIRRFFVLPNVNNAPISEVAHQNRLYLLFVLIWAFCLAVVFSFFHTDTSIADQNSYLLAFTLLLVLFPIMFGAYSKFVQTETVSDAAESSQQRLNSSVRENDKAIEKSEEELYVETDKHLDKMVFRLSIFEKFWIAFGFICACVSALAAFHSYHLTMSHIHSGKEVGSTTLHYILLIKGIFLTGIPAALATYSFRISRAYIHERLKRQERKHAIHFGKLILKKFDIKTVKDEGIDVNELVNLFQWNIANDTAFNKHDYNQIETTNLLKEIARVLKDRKTNRNHTTNKAPDPEILN